MEVSEDEIGSLALDSADDAVISVIVTIPMDPKKMSANLKAPLIFNLKNRRGKQVIVKDPQHNTKHFIMEEIKKHARKDLQTEIRQTAQHIQEQESKTGST